MVDLNQYYRLEDLSTDQLDIIYNYSKSIIPTEIVYSDIYVVGSYCFNLKEQKTSDLDMVVILCEKTHPIDSVIGKNYDIVNFFGRISFEKLNPVFKKPVQLIPKNKPKFLSQMYDSNIKAPYYNLLEKKWYNKKPYDYFPYTWAKSKNSEKKEWVYRDKVSGKYL